MQNRSLTIRLIASVAMLLLLQYSGYAQTDITQLLAQLKVASTDSAKSDVYYQVFEHYQYSNPDSAIYYLQDGLKQFSAKNSRYGIASMIAMLGYQDATQGRMELAKKRQTEALKIFEELNNKNGIAVAHNGLGVIDGRSGNFSDAMRHFMTALKLFQDIGNTKGIIVTYLKLGVVNELNGDLDKALDYYNKALVLSSDSAQTNSKAYIYNNLGIIYAKKGDLKKSLEYFRSALQKSDKPEYTGVRILSLINTGIVYDEFNDDVKALQYFNEALQITKDKNLPEDHARIIVNIASITSKTNPKQAITDLGEALGIAKQLGQKSIMRDIYTGLLENYKQIGDYKDAVAIMEEQEKLEHSIFTVEKAKEIANLESVYDLEQSNARIEEMKHTQQRDLLKRNIIIAVAAGLAIALIFISVFYRKTKRLNEQLSKREAELAKSNTVKDKLFSIIGHDLRGPIGNIPIMLQILEDESTSPDERKYLHASLMSHTQASMETLDKLLYWGKSQIKGRGLKQEIFNTTEYLENNLKLVKTSADQKQITVLNKVSTDTNICCDPAHFDFILRNLLSNAIKFTHLNGLVEVSADKNNIAGFTVFAIKDNGIGIKNEKLSKIFEPFSSSTRGTADEKGTSMGLMLCKEFVTENGGQIWADSTDGAGTTFYCSFKSA